MQVLKKTINDFKTKNILVIDGCPIDCGKRILEKNGMTDFSYMRVTDLGFKKGKTPVTDENIQKIYEKAEVVC